MLRVKVEIALAIPDLTDVGSTYTHKEVAEGVKCSS